LIGKEINEPIFMVLGDKRLKKYKSSLLLEMINTEMHTTDQFSLVAIWTSVLTFCVPWHLKLEAWCAYSRRQVSWCQRLCNYVQSLFSINVYKLQYKFYYKLRMILLRNFSNGMKLHFHKLLSYMTPNLLLMTSPNKWTILRK